MEQSRRLLSRLPAALLSRFAGRRVTPIQRRWESIVIVCPDTNIALWPARLDEAATGGGKSAILRLASAWAQAGHRVTIAGASVVEGEHDGFALRQLSHAAGCYDVAIYVTGLVGHFQHPAVETIQSKLRILWQNPPHKVEFPPGRPPDWIIVPARFIAQRAASEWGYPAERIVVIPGEAVNRRAAPTTNTRDERSIVYASHPRKGLREAIEVIARVRHDHAVGLDVYGSPRLWHDDDVSSLDDHAPEWVSFKGDVPAGAMAGHMERYGVMLYLTTFVDAFSSATAEALAAGVIVIASNHGSNAEFIRHGWNGFLVPSTESQGPDRARAEALLRWYLAEPSRFAAVRRRASASVPSWDEQAAQWRDVWRSG